MKVLRQGTACTVEAGPFSDIIDAVTPLEALGSQSGRIIKNGTSIAFTPDSWGGGTIGYYAVGITTTHSDTVGRLRIAFSSPSTYIPVWEDFMVMAQPAYDAWFATGAGLTDDIEFKVELEQA